MSDAPTFPDWYRHLPAGPLFIEEAGLRDFASAFQRREEMLTAATLTAPAQRYSTLNKTAIIQILGPLVNFGSVDLSRFGATSFGFLCDAIESAVADQRIDAIALTINSPGGVVEGSDAVVDALRRARSVKPMIAHVGGTCASCAYLFAAQASEIVATRSSRLGSIGVYSVHHDLSGAYAKAGVAVTMVFSGQKKVDGNPYGGLDSAVLQEWQEEVDDMRFGFANDVGIGRGARLTAAAALATEARVYRAMVNSTGRSEAIDHGLLDRIGTLKDTVATLSAPRSPASSFEEIQTMSTTVSTPAVTAASERARIGAILNLDEAKGREASAQHLALATTMTADEAKALLATMPRASAAAAAPVIDRRLDPAIGLSLVDTNEQHNGTSMSVSWDRAIASANAGVIDRS